MQAAKGYIARCRMFVGARTHATIAAYSSAVPTLVLGYSIKSRGIAADIFGTEKNYTIGYHELTNMHTLTNAFQFIEMNEGRIREQLKNAMPEYIEKARDVKEPLIKLIQG